MNKEFLKKRILETVTEIFPLDRILSLETVWLIFEKEYAKLENKNIFFKDRKYQRLREGYFAMFVAASLQQNSDKLHYLVFPSKPDNDVYIAYGISNNEKEKPKLAAYEFDIKEFTEHSSTFNEFMHKSIIPKIDIYNIAIPTYRKIDESDFKLLIDYSQLKNLDKKIWLLGLPTENDEGYAVSRVTIINKDGILYQEIINLNDWLDKSKPSIVFQDVIRFK